MQAIILAAGMGKRLKELTRNNTKCMVEVNGKTLIDRMLHQIDERDFSRIIIVIGYEGQKLTEYIEKLDVKTPITFINNPIYYKTNNIYSLSLADEWLCKEDTILFESDIIFEDAVLDAILLDSRDTLALVDKYESWMDGTCLKLDAEDTIVSFVAGKNLNYDEIGDYYKTVNIYKFSKHFSQTHYVPFLKAYQSALGQNEYYEQVLKIITMIEEPVIKAKRLSGQNWYEIDDIQDLDIAESLFADDNTRADRIISRYGGYWRYPKMLDYCYLVNPYFPPKRLKEELKSNFDTLLTEYPSGMKVNCLLASRFFEVNQENIVIGNGAAELIKSLLESFEGNVGFIWPTFEEYPNRYDKKKTIIFRPEGPDYTYSANDIMERFDNEDISCLVVINPDNPSGNYMPKADVLKLINWTKLKSIKLILDESFVDFADEENSSIIDQQILNDNPHLYVMKSISKSYGVPGIRLGVLASGDVEAIARIKNDVSIWNINSFGEYYMQIAEKYKNDYLQALKKLREERKRFEAELQNVEALRVIHSQANYVMVELVGTMSSRELLVKLLCNHNILIKDLKAKTGGNYIRLAVRDSDDNDRLVAAIKAEIS